VQLSGRGYDAPDTLRAIDTGRLNAQVTRTVNRLRTIKTLVLPMILFKHYCFTASNRLRIALALQALQCTALPVNLMRKLKSRSSLKR
jgi:hypothetical protein